MPGLAAVAADHGPLAIGLQAVAIDADQRAGRVQDQVGRGAVKAQRLGRGPGPAAVGGLGLDQRKVDQAALFQAGGVAVVLHAHQAEQPAIGQLDDVRLVVLLVHRALEQRHGAQRLPRAPAVGAGGGPDRADPAPVAVAVGQKAFAQVEQAPVPEADRAVRCGDGHADRRAPRVAAVVAQADPRSHPARRRGVGDAGKAGGIAGNGRLIPGLAIGLIDRGQARVGAEPGQEQLAAAQGHDARVTVVDRQVVDHGGRGPRAAPVDALGDHGPPKGTDVGVAQPRGGDDQGALLRSGHGRPAKVPEKVGRVAADDPVFGLDAPLGKDESHGVPPLVIGG